MVKNPPANAGATGLIPGSGRSPGEGYGNPLQYSCLENSMDRGAWRAMVHGVAKALDVTEWLNNNNNPSPPPSPQLEVWLFPSGGRGWGVHSSPKEGHDQVQVPRSSVPAAEITAHRTHVNPWIDEPRVEGDGRRQNQVSALLPEPLKEDRPASVLKSQSEKYSSQWVLSG